jgi:hypothetical protein
LKKIFHVETASNVNNDSKTRTVNWVATATSENESYRGTVEVPFDGDEDVIIMNSLRNALKVSKL